MTCHVGKRQQPVRRSTRLRLKIHNRLILRLGKCHSKYEKSLDIPIDKTWIVFQLNHFRR
jgi:hypothetical protein